MQWPKKIVAAFSKVPIEPESGMTKKEVIQYMLDETAKIAVSRAGFKSEKLAAAYCELYTRLSVVSVELSLTDKVRTITIDERWDNALNVLYPWVENNAMLVCDSFCKEQKPWPWDS